MLGQATGRGQCQSWQGQSGSHGSVMGALTHASRPCACWTTCSWSSPALAHGHTHWPSLPCLLTWPSCSSPSDPSPFPRPLPGPKGTVSRVSSSGRAQALVCPCPKCLGFSKCLERRWHLVSSTTCSSLTFWGSAPFPFLALPGPALERSPWEWLLGGSREEMGKQGTLHPRKHPGSSAGVVPEHRRKQTDSNTHRQIQTHTETHTPNGHFPSP